MRSRQPVAGDGLKRRVHVVDGLDVGRGVPPPLLDPVAIKLPQPLGAPRLTLLRTLDPIALIIRAIVKSKHIERAASVALLEAPHRRAAAASARCATTSARCAASLSAKPCDGRADGFAPSRYPTIVMIRLGWLRMSTLHVGDAIVAEARAARVAHVKVTIRATQPGLDIFDAIVAAVASVVCILGWRVEA